MRVLHARNEISYILHCHCFYGIFQMMPQHAQGIIQNAFGDVSGHHLRVKCFYMTDFECAMIC